MWLDVSVKFLTHSAGPSVFALAITAALLAGCSGGASEPASAPATAQAPVVVPGDPGEEARTIAPGETIPPSLLPPRPSANDADLRFVRLMIPHHTQAVEMSALAADRAKRPALERLADRIRVGQAPEIAVLRQWLVDHRQAPAAGHEHDADMGMASAEEMRELAAARGDAFDRLYVRLMVRHHEGAIRMAQEQSVQGTDPRMLEMADAIAVEQGVEVRRLQQTLEG